MNKSQRIWLDTESGNDDKYIHVKLQQEVDTLEIMSLKIDTKEAYQDFNANYGVLAGRVTANNGITIPNAKVSVFIPLDEEDENDGEIVSIYPYKKPSDKNNEGKRYNLLPRVSQINPETGEVKPKQAFGSFPTKQEIVTNPTYLEVYKKYYKYTTVTNNSGDYMIFGVPVGTQTVHVSADITDIGRNSMTPAAMVTNLGYSPNFFTDNNSKIKPSTNLEDLPHIETQEISTDVIPFWGDSANFDIGITRVDFRIRATVQNVFYVFGSVFTDGDDAMWGDDSNSGVRQIGELYRAKDDVDTTIGMFSKRIGNITERIYYYPSNISDEDIDNNNVDPKSDMQILDSSEYSVFKRDGDFVFIINCNRNKIKIDETGNEVATDDDDPNGVFTEFRGFITLEINNDSIPMEFSSAFGSNTRITPYRLKLKFPQYGAENQFFDKNDGTDSDLWRRQHKKFKANKFYSFARFHGITKNEDGNSDLSQFSTTNGFFKQTKVNDPYERNAFYNIGIIVTESYDDNPNADYDFPSNTIVKQSGNNRDAFGANWMNLSIYLPQVGYVSQGSDHIREVRAADYLHNQKEENSSYNRYYVEDNQQQIAAGIFNTKFYGRNDLHWTDIIEVPEDHIREMNNITAKGFTDLDVGDLDFNNVEYRNGESDSIPSDWGVSNPCPYDGGKQDGDADNTSSDSRYYFYKGFGDADCIQYLFELGIVTG